MKSLGDLKIGDKLISQETGEGCEISDIYMDKDIRDKQEVYYYFRGFSVPRKLLKAFFITKHGDFMTA